MQHDLKVWPEYFEPIRQGLKTFEIRKVSDRDFRVGDTLVLSEWDEYDRHYTGRAVKVKITYILSLMGTFNNLNCGEFLIDDYFIIGFKAEDAQPVKVNCFISCEFNKNNLCTASEICLFDFGYDGESCQPGTPEDNKTLVRSAKRGGY